MNTRLIVGLIIAVLIVILLIQNSMVVSINIFFWKIQVSQLLLILICFGLGLITGILLRTFFPAKK
ncbi:LapA family protein [bacterium]|nr:LapA family protein [bacterium]